MIMMVNLQVSENRKQESYLNIRKEECLKVITWCTFRGDNEAKGQRINDDGEGLISEDQSGNSSACVVDSKT